MRGEVTLAQELLSLEERLLQPHVRKDAVQVAALLSDTFVEFGSSGAVYNKASIISALSRELPAHRRIVDFKAQSLADGVALVTYRAIRSNEPDGSSVASIRSSIWKRISGEWKMVFHQGTLTARDESAF